MQLALSVAVETKKHKHTDTYMHSLPQPLDQPLAFTLGPVMQRRVSLTVQLFL